MGAAVWMYGQLSMAALLNLVTENDPPNNMPVNGNIVGASTDKVVELMRRADVDYTLDLMPWARAYQYAKQRDGYCVFSTARVEDRERLFRWVGPIAATEWVLYGKTDSPPVDSLDAVGNRVIGGYLGDVISSWLISHGYKVESVNEDSVNPGKLMNGRLAYWASARPRAEALLTERGLNDKIRPLLVFGKTDLYLACHLSTSVELVYRLNQILEMMRADGTFTVIDRRYLAP
ncbi:transporter substrate-binding domain-containing protein [Chitinivorax sp. B]|uniref:substrate-binding periplasmic protein n=1 Tax=Chitinivorax sp. B TaxID=2502235 RepID=UPI001484EA3D|nr:transporter substrate-binding domain-containing protein [Chitinivorax sp. B]